jgi:PEP-CTERM motif
MDIRRCLPAAFVAFLAIPLSAAADPLTIVSGMIQTYGSGTTFLFQTKAGPGLAGDTEGLGTPPVFISGQPGDVVNLSSSVDAVLSDFSVFDPERRDLAARAVFDFRAEDAELPTFTAVAGAPDGLGLLAAPFTFTGTLFVYPTYAALLAGGPPALTYALRGTGTADLMLLTNPASDGHRLLAYSAVYSFAADAAPVPEPGTLALFGSAAAALVARRRRLLRR